MSAIDAAEIVVVAVKPQIVPKVLSSITSQNPHAWQNKLVVSIAAGVTMKQLGDWTGADRIVRVMPNTPAMVGMWASAYCCAECVSTDDRAELVLLLDAIGISVEVPEYQLDAVTGLSGSGPAYVFTFIESLADGGVMAGLPRDTAMKLAIQTVRGAAELLLRSGEHPGVLKDAVASPAGTTIAGLARLEQNAFRSAAMEAVVAAAKRSEELRGNWAIPRWDLDF
jgi:pyrroline-5-carboxylate reductase